MRAAADEFDRRIRIERPVADDSLDGAGSGSWELVATIWAGVKDILPSRAEKAPSGINFAARPARIRIRYREDITPDMRFVLGARVMQIVAGPADIGIRDKQEYIAEDYRPAGNAA